MVLVAVAAATRWFRIDAQSLWYDEGISAHQLTRSFGEIVGAAALDTHPPLYYWTLKAWSLIVPASELGLRSLSAVWGVVCVGLTFFIGRKVFAPLPAAVAALLLAVAPLAVYYSQEVRMYTQVTGLGLLAAYGLLSGRYWLYALAGLAALYSQYLGAAMLIAVNVYGLATWRCASRREWLSWWVANAVIALGFAPWWRTFIDQQSHALNTSPRTLAGLALETATAYGGGLARSEVAAIWGACLVALALAGGAIALADPSRRRGAVLPLALWLVPLGLVLLLGLRSGLYEVRYLLLSMPGLLLLAGYGIARLTRWPIAAGVVALLAVVPFGLALERQYFDPKLMRDDYRGLVASIEHDARPTDAVLLSAPNQAEVFDFYYRGPLPQVGLPLQRPVDADDTRRRLEDMRQSHDRLWLVAWAMDEADPRGVIKQWLAENGFQARHDWYGSVQLVLVGFGRGQATTYKVGAAFEDGVKLDVYRLSSRTVRSGETVALTLVWRASGGPTAVRWKVFTHLLDSQSKVVAQRDAEPADNLRPTTSWRPGEQIEDNYGLVVPPDVPPGTYTLEIGLYNGERRSQIAGQGDHLILGDIEVSP